MRERERESVCVCVSGVSFIKPSVDFILKVYVCSKASMPEPAQNPL